MTPSNSDSSITRWILARYLDDGMTQIAGSRAMFWHCLRERRRWRLGAPSRLGVRRHGSPMKGCAVVPLPTRDNYLQDRTVTPGYSGDRSTVK